MNVSYRLSATIKQNPRQIKSNTVCEGKNEAVLDISL